MVVGVVALALVSVALRNGRQPLADETNEDERDR
jgi:hypothetical protein